MPDSTISSINRSYSAVEPSAHSTHSGRHRASTSATHASNALLFVLATVVSSCLQCSFDRSGPHPRTKSRGLVRLPSTALRPDGGSPAAISEPFGRTESRCRECQERPVGSQDHRRLPLHVGPAALRRAGRSGGTGGWTPSKHDPSPCTPLVPAERRVCHGLGPCSTGRHRGPHGTGLGQWHTTSCRYSSGVQGDSPRIDSVCRRTGRVGRMAGGRHGWMGVVETRSIPLYPACPGRKTCVPRARPVQHRTSPRPARHWPQPVAHHVLPVVEWGARGLTENRQRVPSDRPRWPDGRWSALVDGRRRNTIHPLAPRLSRPKDVCATGSARAAPDVTEARMALASASGTPRLAGSRVGCKGTHRESTACAVGQAALAGWPVVGTGGWASSKHDPSPCTPLVPAERRVCHGLGPCESQPLNLCFMMDTGTMEQPNQRTRPQWRLRET